MLVIISLNNFLIIYQYQIVIDSFVKTLKQIEKTSSRIFKNNSSRNLFISSNINTFFRFHQILISNTWFLCNERFSSIHSEIKLHRIPALFLFFLFFLFHTASVYIIQCNNWLLANVENPSSHKNETIRFELPTLSI